MRRESGSISAPARKVRRTAPKVARKLTHSLVCRPRKLPPITPMPISISATEMPVRIETTLATKASSIHAAATNQMLVACAIIGSTRSLPPDALEGHDPPSLAAHETLPDVRHRRNALFGLL